MGYLGKISAVVSVNTGDFSSKINRLKGDVNSFAASTQRSLADAARASSKSFGSIYTEVQKLERALQAASRLEFNGLKGFNGRSLSQAAEQMRTISSIASQLSAPLGKVVQSIEQMDPAIQRHLLAPMLSAQKAVEGLQTKARNGGLVLDSSFRAAESRLDRLTTAANRAKEAMAAASGIGGGGGFKFQQPLANQEFQRGAGLFSMASSLSADRVTPDLVRLLNKQKAAADAATQSSVAFAAKPNQENAESLKMTVDNLEIANNNLQRLLDSYTEIDAKAAKIKQDLADADAAREKSAAALLSMQQQYQQALTGEAQTIDQLQSRYNALASSAARLPSENRSVAGKGMAGDVSIVQGILASGDTSRLVAGNQALARAEAVVATQAKEVKSAEDKAADAKRRAADETSRLAKESAALASLEARRLQIVTGEAQNIAQLESQYGSLLSRLEKLPDAYRAAAAAAVSADAQMVATVIAEGTDADVGAVRGELANISGGVAGYEARAKADADAAAAAVATAAAAAEEEARILAIVEADRKASEERIAALAKSIHDEEMAAIAAERAEREKADAERAARAASLLAMQQQYQQALTGEAQTIDQLRSRYNSLVSSTARLPAANRATAGAGMAGDVSIVQGILEKGDATQLVAGNQALARAEAVVATQAKTVADAEEQAAQAKKDAADATEKLAKQTATLASLEARRMQIATGEAQTVDQLRTKYDSLLSRLEKLPAQYRAAANAAVAADAQMVATVVAEGTDADVGAVKGEVANLEQIISGFEDTAVKAKEATKAADEFRDSLSKIADAIGDPSEPIDQLRKAVQEANAEIAKMKPGAAKTAAEAAMRGLKSQIAGAPDDAEALRLAGVARGIGGQASTINAAPKKKTVEEVFGKDIGSAGRQADSLKDKIIALQGQFEKLPKATQAGFGKMIANLRNDYMALGDNPSAAAVKKLEKDYEAAERAVKRFNQAASFKGTFKSYLNDSSVKYFEAQLGAVQSRMAEIGATAGGPVAKAIKKYRDELAQAAKAGQLGTDATRKQMKARVEEIAQAAMQEKLFNKAQAKAFVGGVMRSGDVGRMGADKFALGLNQAAFAIDDFMSATGGIEMKIRAISNNISQLGFIVGGTAGLFVSLGVTVAAQAAIMAYKFANGGKAAEDTSKALNEALQKQKSIVQELASAYKDLSSDMKLSGPGQAGVANATALGGIKAANEEFRRSRLMGVNSDVVGEVATQASIDRRVQNATTVGELAYRNELRRQSVARQSAAEATARRGVPGAAGDLNEMKEKRRAVASTLSRDLEVQLYDLIGAPTWSGKFRELSGILADLESQIRATEDSMVELANSASEAAFASAQTSAARIEAASNLLSGAIERGVPGALTFQNNLDSLAMEMSGALKSISAAASIEDPRQRATAISAAQASISEITRKTAGIIEQTLRPRIEAAFAGPTAGDALGQVAAGPRGARTRASLVAANERAAVEKAKFDNAAMQSAAARAEQTRVKLEGERRVRESFSAGVELQNDAVFKEGNKSKFSKKEIDEARAKANAAGDEYRAQVAQAKADSQAAQANVDLADAAREAARADYEAAQAASRLEAAIQATSQAMEDFASRTRKIGEDALSSSIQAADAAQQRFIDKPTERNRKARDDAERQMIADKERLARADARITQKMSDIQSDPVIAKANEEIRAIDEQIQRMQATQANTGIPLDAATLRDAENRRAAAVADRERRQFDLTAPERAAFDAEAQDIKRRQREAEEARPEFGREFRAAERSRVRQGREDAMTTRERQKLEAERGAENMAAAAGAFGTQAERKAFVQQFYDNRKKDILQSGPMGQAADERFNAMAPGARRIGIEASDVATAEGSRELNRLLRGDDANKDANFAEMQRQTELLSDIRDGIQANTGIGVIDR